LHLEIYYSARMVRVLAYDECNCEEGDENEEQDWQEGEGCDCDDERECEEAEVVNVVEDAVTVV